MHALEKKKDMHICTIIKWFTFHWLYGKLSFKTANRVISKSALLSERL